MQLIDYPARVFRKCRANDPSVRYNIHRLVENNDRMPQSHGTQPSTQIIDVAGLRTQYLVAGAGPPLVLLHGIGDSAADWQWVMPGLAQHHRVYALDLPGHGGSAAPDVDYSATLYAHFTTRFLDALGVNDAVLVGHSLGGLAALCVALALPERVRALVLVDSAGLGREVNIALRLVTTPGYGDLAMMWVATPLGSVQRVLSRLPLLFANPARAPLAWLQAQYRLGQQPGFRWATLAELRSQVDLAGQRRIMVEQLRQLAMPTLLIWGEYDQVVPVEQARAALAHLQHGQLSVIPDSGHLPQIEQSQRFVAALSNFLNEGDQGSCTSNQ